MRIGNKAGRRNYFPAGPDIVARANTRLESLTATANTMAKRAMRVDGVPTLIWNKLNTPSRVCTCSRKAERPLGGDDADYAGQKILGLASSEDPSTKKKTLSTTRTLIYEDGDTAAWSTQGPHVADSQRDRPRNIDQNSNLVDHQEALLDMAELQADMDGEITGAPSFESSFLNGATVQCPVCAGTGFVDAWRPRAAARLIFNFDETYEHEYTGWLDLSTKPYTLVLEPGQSVTWQMKLPRYFSHVLALRAWERSSRARDAVIVLPESSNATATRSGLMAFSGGDSAQTVTLKLTAPRRMLLTHIELTILLTPLPYLQFPQLNLPYEREFLDINTNASIEAPADVLIQPGDVLCDSKYKRVWRVTSANPKKTAGGNTLTQTADLRMTMSSEVYQALNVFDGTEDIVGDRPYKGYTTPSAWPTVSPLSGGAEQAGPGESSGEGYYPPGSRWEEADY